MNLRRTLLLACLLALVSAVRAEWTDISIDLRTKPMGEQMSKYLVISGSSYNYYDNDPGTYNAYLTASSFNGDQHGYVGFTATVPVEAGYYKINVGTCQFNASPTSLTVKDTEDHVLGIVDKNGQDATSLSLVGTCDATTGNSHNESAWYNATAAGTIKIVFAQYTPYFSIEKVDALPSAATIYTVTFANTTEGATGTVPTAKEVASGENITLPTNYTLYKDGHTLKYWNDGEADYAPGASYTPTSNVTLTAKFEANSVTLAERTSAVTIAYNLTGSGSNPRYNFNGTAGFMVTQATVNGVSIDVKADVDATASGAKFTHNGSTWHQVNKDTKVTVPSCDGATIAVTTYNSAESVNFNNGTSGVTTEGETATYTSSSDNTTAEIEQVSNDYWNNLVITLPSDTKYTVTYYDVDGTKLGEQKVNGGSTIGTFAFTANPTSGYSFRGWYTEANGGGTKVTTSTAVNADLDIYAYQTETMTVTGSSQNVLDFRVNSFDINLYDGIFTVSNGSHHGNRHGYQFNSSGVITAQVAGEAYIRFELCQFSNESSTITMQGTDGNDISSIPTKVAACDQFNGFHYTGGAGTISFKIAGGYVHRVLVQNVSDASTMPQQTNGMFVVKTGDADDLKDVLNFCQIVSPCIDKTIVYLPNGTYDLGSTCRTEVGSNIVMLGESRDGVVICNTPTAAGIQATSVLRITGDNVYLQNLTLRNDFDYANAGSYGVAVALEIEGDNSICNNVQLLSNQDTYYSHSNNTALKGYFKGGRIEGTVDYVCGNGNMWFEGTEFYNRARSSSDVIFAPATLAGTTYGYVCNNCVVDGAANQNGNYNIARPWSESPALTLLNTTFKQLPTSAGYTSMTNGLVVRFHESNSKDGDGNAVTGHNITACNGAAGSHDLYSYDVSGYTYANVLGGWDPEATIKLYSASLTSNVGKWASYTPTFNCVLADANAKAYIVTAIDKSSYTVTATPVSVMKAGEGYFVHTASGNETVAVNATYQTPDDITGNMLVGCLNDTPLTAEGNTKYFLGVKGATAGLYYVDTNITIPAGKCYLQSTDTEKAPLGIDIQDGQTTGISAIEHSTLNIEHSEVYNLNGQRVSKPTKGLYIVNGRKVIVK